MPKVLADAFLERLVEIGIVPEGTTHVIINAKAGDVTMLHYSKLTLDEELLEMMAPMKAELKPHGG